MRHQKGTITMLKKRGITPLIATVILVGFAVAIIVLVMLWSSTYIKDIQEKQGSIAEARLNCATDISFNVQNIEQFGTQFAITLENMNQPIDSFFIVIRGDNDQQTVTVNTPLAATAITTLDAVYDETIVGQAQEIDIIPRIEIAGGVYESCSGQHEVYELA